ncbi:sesquipedalian-1-like isoform X2 [Clupea harengus]|uniref:Sesquipedalian n=1 Tax=Clupea harengus TaxID=7950 RepID=A0A6P3VMT2_CLUHA|nr:sesquipedalian-1-like isoform X2 [Clupea harengus]XP_031417032.1 sesquipedalian-1-like isoform X2 [Clupea harengus]XP_031417033.1 sesquipedalian-1-like isoform X2 [Clupea harengus]
MKIHGKILNHYISCSSSVDKEGYLYKKGEVNTSYQKRWCILKGNLLFYKERQSERDVLGVIVLEGCAVQLCESEEKFAFSLVFSEPGLRTYKFAVEDQPSQESWIKALLSANHGYLTLLLKDLQEQYLEATRAAGEAPADPQRLWVDTMVGHPQSWGPGSGSVFYTNPPALDVRDSAGHSSQQLLQATAALAKAANKRSPKLWPKRNALVAPINCPAPPQGEWSEPTEDFGQMHEEFGKEVKELIADWLRRKQGEASGEGDLIDLG